MIKKILVLLLVSQMTMAGGIGDFLEEVEKAGTVVNTYENITCQKGSHASNYKICQKISRTGGHTFKKMWPQICEVVTHSELCKGVENKDRVDCSDPDENKLNVKSLKFIKNCGIGFFFESLKEFVIFLKDIVIATGSFIFDGKYRQNVSDKAGEYWDSLKNYIAIEYAKEYDKTQNKSRAMVNVGGSFVITVFEKIGQVISKSYHRLGCYHQAKRQELMCKVVGEFIMPPAIALGLIFKGPLLIKKLVSINKKVTSSPNRPKGLKLVARDDDLLRRELEVVPNEEIGSPEFNQMVDNLTITMKKKGGVGIAANQAGIDKRVIVLKSSKKGNLTLINPEVTTLSNKKVLSFEACLSIKWSCGFIKRDKEIEVAYTDIDGKAQVWRPKGFDRKLVQHEVDHLNGKLWVYHKPRFSRKFGIKPIRVISQEKRVQFHRYLDGLNKDQKANLKSIKKGVNDVLQRLGKGSVLATAKGRSVDEKFDLATAILKRLIEKTDTDENFRFLFQKIQTDQDALVIYDILKRVHNREARVLISRLREGGKIDVVDTFRARGPPYNNPLVLQIKKFGRGDKKVEVPFTSLEEAIRYSNYVDEFKVKYFPGEKAYQVRFPEGGGDITLDIKDLRKTFELVDEYKKQGAKKYSDLDWDGDGSTFYVEGNPSRRVTFGIESEMSFVENPGFLKDYKVIGYTDEDWNKLSLDKRLEVAKKAKESIGWKKPFLEKLPHADKRLPKIVINEIDGRFEINGLIFSNLDEAKDFVNFIERRYGKSSLQGHVVRDNKTPFSGSSGYTVFNADYAQINALERNFDIYSKNPDFVPARNLSHHSLGPLSDANLKMYRKMEKSVGKKKGASNVERGGHRVVYAPVMRSKPYYDGMVGFELRQFHKRGEALLEDMADLAGELQRKGGLEKYEVYARHRLVHKDLPQERAKDFGITLSKGWHTTFSRPKSLFTAVGNKMKSRFPGVIYGGASVENRFFFPLRDWKEYPAVKSLDETARSVAVERVEAATKRYLLTLDSKVKNWNGKAVSDQDLKELQIATSQWGKESGLKEIMEREKRRISNDKKKIFPDYVKTSNERNVQYLERVDGPMNSLDIETKTFPNGSSYKEIKINKSFKVSNPDYQDFLENSVEILYTPSIPYGHIYFRVGDRLYSFDYVKTTTRTDFMPTQGLGKVGFAYSVPKEKIKMIKKDIEKFYSDSQEFNVAPFDAHSHKLKVKPIRDGEVKFKSPGFLFSNNKRAQADIVELNDGSFVLETPSKMRYPLERSSTGEFCTQSFSCSTSAVYLLEKYFGIKNKFNHGAKSLRDTLLKGNPDGTTPNFVFQY